MISEGRGQSATMGIILLFGIVAIGSMSVLLVAGQTVSEAEQRAAEEHVTQGFVELSSELETVTYSSDTATTMDMAVGDQAAVRKENTGWIRINASGLEENISLGAIVYEGEHTSTIAYQAGGVWRGTGTDTQMVSAPPVHYEDSTLTLPVNSVAGDREISSGRITIEHNRTNSYDNASFVENEVVTLEIKSEYYVGWKEYFASASSEAVIDDVDHGTNTVVVKLGRKDIEDAFDSGATYSDRIDDSHGSIEEEAESGTAPPMDEVIHDIVAEANDGEMEIDEDLGSVDEHESLSDGAYLADEIREDGHLEFDLTEGNATLVVDGDIDADGDTITVSDYADGHVLKIYATGDFDASNGGNVCVEPCSENTTAKVIQLFGTSEMQIDFGPGGNSRYEGVLYAASDEDEWGDRAGSCDETYQAAFQSNPNFFGSLVAASICGQADAIDFEYDDTLENEQIRSNPQGYVLPPPITYLNVVVHEVDVRET